MQSWLIDKKTLQVLIPQRRYSSNALNTHGKEVMEGRECFQRGIIMVRAVNLSDFLAESRCKKA
jgi:hypothetical protein